MSTNLYTGKEVVPFNVGDIVISTWKKKRPQYARIVRVEEGPSQSGVLYQAETIKGKPIANGDLLDHTWFATFDNYYRIGKDGER